MAAGRLPLPGTKLGPCVEPCQHKDCAANRRMAVGLCRFCNAVIGYETRFYKDPDADDAYVNVHARCLENIAELAPYERRNESTGVVFYRVAIPAEFICEIGLPAMAGAHGAQYVIDRLTRVLRAEYPEAPGDGRKGSQPITVPGISKAGVRGASPDLGRFRTRVFLGVAEMSTKQTAEPAGITLLRWEDTE